MKTTQSGSEIKKDKEPFKEKLAFFLFFLSIPVVVLLLYLDNKILIKIESRMKNKEEMLSYICYIYKGKIYLYVLSVYSKTL